MKQILDNIVAVKRAEVADLKRSIDRDGYQFPGGNPERRSISLRENLLREGSTGIIAEFKRRSPSRGWFTREAQPAAPVVVSYQQHGAAGVSILTDKEFFGGALEDIDSCRAFTALPVLRKDFIIDGIQVQEAKAWGADVILLIAAILTPKEVEALAAGAKKYGLEVLLELHGENELDHICDGIDMVGINNRNLQTFGVNIDHSIKLANRLPGDLVRIAESGIDDVETVRRFRDAGFQGFLIGEQFMKAPDPGRAFEEFTNKLKQV